jgi:hypothetical protein
MTCKIDGDNYLSSHAQYSYNERYHPLPMKKFTVWNRQSHITCSGRPCLTECSVVLCPCKPINHMRIIRAVFSMTLHCTLLDACNPLSTHVSRLTHTHTHTHTDREGYHVHGSQEKSTFTIF